MLDITKHKHNHIELHLGAYFRGFVATMAGFFMTLCVAAIGIILGKDLIESAGVKAATIISLVILFGVFLNLFLGFEGVEFDLETRKFRHYVKRLGFKTGKWRDLKPYTLLCLSAQYNSIGGAPTPTAKGGLHRSLEINLASLKGESVLLAECKNYKDAIRALNRLNDFLGLEVKDFVKADYLKPSPRRR